MARNLVLDALKRLLYPKPLTPVISANDKMLLERFRETVEQHRSDPEFTTTVAAASLGMSRMHLNRKLRALTGYSTHQYIRETRLEGARALLSQPLPVAFVAQSFGFRSKSNFAKAFRKRFGTTPSAFRARTSRARQPTQPRPSGK